MIIDEAAWRSLELPQRDRGRVVKRLHPDAPLDVHMAVGHPSGQRMLILKSDARTVDSIMRPVSRLPKTAGIELSLAAVSNQLYELQIVLSESDLREVFSPLVSDVANVAAMASTATAALTGVVTRFERWQALLRTIRHEGLSMEVRRGLYGELLLLENYVLPVTGSEEAVTGWTGPGGSNQDFELVNAAVECKVTTGRAGGVKITSERQLDDTGIPTLLLAQVALDERRGGSGESLADRVHSIREKLGSGVLRVEFDAKLVQSGYLQMHHDQYSEPKYTVRETHLWEVKEGFPRIVEGQLPVGVSDCSYIISIAALRRFAISRTRWEEVLRSKNG